MTGNGERQRRESIGRTIVVLDDQPYLWAALRQRLDPALAYVRSATAGELTDVWRSCRPWPWILVGASPVAPTDLPDLLDGLPIVVHWVGRPPAGLPATPSVHPDWTTLVVGLERLRELAHRGRNGVRLLRNRGLQTPDGRIVLGVAHLEGLMAAPDGLALRDDGAADRLAARLRSEIDDNRLPLRLERDGRLLRLA
ncbi:MAG TPA: hypothetical protein VFD49_25930 [Candidatus Dormibacteraeota bacterium]|nr:hypothetical protein [Candidatus Dormibacteraeota bacterium]